MVVVCMGGVGIAGGVVLDLVSKFVGGGGGGGGVLAARRHRFRHNGRQRRGNDVEAQLLPVRDHLLLTRMLLGSTEAVVGCA